MRRGLAAVTLAVCACLPALAAAEETPNGYGTFDQRGAELTSNANGKGLVIAAPIIFGASWLGSVPLALESNELGMIPVVGPWLALATKKGLDGGLMGGLALDGIAQLGALGLLAVGIHLFEWEVAVDGGFGTVHVSSGASEQLTMGGTF